MSFDFFFFLLLYFQTPWIRRRQPMRKTTVGISKVLIFVFVLILSKIHLMSSCWPLSLSPFSLFIKQTNTTPKQQIKNTWFKCLNFRGCWHRFRTWKLVLYRGEILKLVKLIWRLSSILTITCHPISFGYIWYKLEQKSRLFFSKCAVLLPSSG